MLVVLACIVVLCLFIFSTYAVMKIKPGWVRVSTRLGRLADFSLEIGRLDDKPADTPEKQISPVHPTPRA